MRQSRHASVPNRVLLILIIAVSLFLLCEFGFNTIDSSIFLIYPSLQTTEVVFETAKPTELAFRMSGLSVSSSSVFQI